MSHGLESAGMEPGRLSHFWGTAAVFLLPSMAMLKHLPRWFVPLYLILGIAGLWLGCRLYPAWRKVFSNRMACLVGLMLLAAVGLLFVAIHPSIDQDGFALFGKTFGSGDADDAIDLALNRLRSAQYPYSQKTFLGLPITPLPGALLLAVPFYAMGESALQNVFWLAVGWLLLSKGRLGFLGATYLWGLILVLCPALLYCVFQGGDAVANGIYILLAMLLFWHRCKTGAFGWVDAVSAIALGVAFSSRLNYLAFVPYAACVGIRMNRSKALAIGGVAALVFLTLTLPFYLWSPAEFSPLHTLGRTGVGRFPALGHAWPVAVLLYSLAMGCVDSPNNTLALMRRCFQIHVAIVACSLAVGSLAAGRLEFEQFSYFLFGTAFGVVGCGLYMLEGLVQAMDEHAARCKEFDSASCT